MKKLINSQNDADYSRYSFFLISYLIENDNYDKAKKVTSNIDYLYFAASSSVNGKDYKLALEYYNLLKDMGYTGIVTEYFVTTVETHVEQQVSVTEFNPFKKSKDYINPRSGDTESRLPEIVKNIALIYVQLGETDKAIAAIKDARKINPEDLNLLLSEADLYMKLGDKDKFKVLMQEAIKRDPENAILYYNLGVINTEQGQFEDAMNYYKKSIELDPTYEASYLNLVGLILEGEASLVDQMNELATSTKRSDYEKYDRLKAKREELYKSCLPFLEKLIDINPNNIEALKTAKNIYYTVGENEKFKLMSSKINELEN